MIDVTQLFGVCCYMEQIMLVVKEGLFGDLFVWGAWQCKRLVDGVKGGKLNQIFIVKKLKSNMENVVFNLLGSGEEF